jgi:hypothetical protein
MVHDEGGLTASSTITITSNRPPTVPDVTKSTEGQPSLHVLLEPFEPDGDDVEVSCDAPDEWLIAITLLDGSDPTHPRFDLDIRVRQDEPFSGVEKFECKVEDSFGASATATVTITNI